MADIHSNDGLPRSEINHCLGGGMTISAGIKRFTKAVRVDAAVASGVKTVVLLSGRQRLRLGDGETHDICGPAVLVIRSCGETARQQLISADVPLRYVIVQMRDDIAGQGIATALAHPQVEAGSVARSTALLMHCPAGRAVRSLAEQIMNCPIRGAERELYLSGKAMQLAALAISSCLSDAGLKNGAQLSSRDIDRIRQARSLLTESMKTPPGLENLAQQVGLNVRKLSDGFRRVYGTTAYGCLQEYRLEQAYKLISSGEMNVSEAAHHVGYGPAHFATIFRKRFNISPSSLR